MIFVVKVFYVIIMIIFWIAIVHVCSTHNGILVDNELTVVLL